VAVGSGVLVGSLVAVGSDSSVGLIVGSGAAVVSVTSAVSDPTGAVVLSSVASPQATSRMAVRTTSINLMRIGIPPFDHGHGLDRFHRSGGVGRRDFPSQANAEEKGSLDSGVNADRLRDAPFNSALSP
jgi:hypothetical protein